MIDMHCHLDLYKNAIELLPEVQRRCKYVLAVTTSPRAWKKTRQVFAEVNCVEVVFIAYLLTHPRPPGSLISLQPLFRSSELHLFSLGLKPDGQLSALGCC